MNAGDDILIQINATGNLSGGRMYFTIDGVIIVGYSDIEASEGVFTITLPKELTTEWPNGTYQAQARYVSPAGEQTSSDIVRIIIENNLIKNEDGTLNLSFPYSFPH